LECCRQIEHHLQGYCLTEASDIWCSSTEVEGVGISGVGKKLCKITFYAKFGGICRVK